ncbi:MAG: putative sulfate exporter family transporter [Steroidobacteraceae bacterium]
MLSRPLVSTGNALVALNERVRGLMRGMIAAFVVATAASFMAEQYHAPLMLFALLLGIGMNFLAAEDRCKPGIEFCARAVLRFGVALLGVRITFEHLAQLSWPPVALVVIAVIATLLVSIAAARMLGFNALFGFLTGGATAICGASAALALSAALPAHPGKEKATTFTIIGVSALSTLAMILYPMLAHWLDLSPQAAGVFIGASIHEVAQVVGAGYSLSHETGDVATIVKLMRVAMLLPVILCAALITRAQINHDGNHEQGERPPLLPWFAVAFILLAAVNSIGWIGPTLQSAGTDVSRWCLAIAMGAIGMKTNLTQLAAVGVKPVILMVGEAVFLAALVLGMSRWLS